jgi:hypothetical protein
MAYSNFYNALLHTRVRHLYSFTFLFVCAGISLWWYFLYQPAVHVQMQLQQSVDQLHMQINELRKIEKTFNGISQSIDTQTMKKNSITKMRKLDAQQSLSLIADSAINSGISLESCKLCGEHENSWCCITDISGNFKGSFDQIISFFDALKKSKQIVDVTQCTLTAHDANTFSLHGLFHVYSL